MSATMYNSQELSPRFRPRMSDSYHPFFLRGRKPKCLATDFPLPVKRIQGNSALNARDPVLWRNLFNPILAISTFGTRILISRERIPERGRACSSSNHARLRFLLQLQLNTGFSFPRLPREFPFLQLSPCPRLVTTNVSTRSPSRRALSVETREEERERLGGRRLLFHNSDFSLAPVPTRCFPPRSFSRLTRLEHGFNCVPWLPERGGGG